MTHESVLTLLLLVPVSGGSCLPKDLRALIKSAHEHDYDLQMLRVIDQVNIKQKELIGRKVLEYFDHDLKGKTIAIWGVAFKANTDDIRETAAIETTHILNSAGANIRFYDPAANANFDKLMQAQNIKVEPYSNKYEVLVNADALIVLTEWQEFRDLDLDKLAHHFKTKVIFDARNIFNARELNQKGFFYFPLGGRPKTTD